MSSAVHSSIKNATPYNAKEHPRPARRPQVTARAVSIRQGHDRLRRFD